MLAIERIAEERIREAMDGGAFDRLPGSGKPLVLDDDRAVPEELRMVYRVLKNAGFIPEELELRRGIQALEASLEGMSDATERALANRRLTFLRIRLESRGGPLLGCGYDEALLRRLDTRS